MNKKPFNPRAQTLLGSLLFVALFLSACAPTAREVAVELATIQAGQAATTVAPPPAGSPATSAPVSAAPTSAPGASIDARAQRLLSADANYRSQGAAAWAQQLGYAFDSLTMEARQPEEETFSESATEAMTVVSGIQVRVTNLRASQPACFTTDQKVAGKARFVKPDNYDPIRNPSVLYTDNEIGYTGTATLWGDCSNWANLMSAPLTQFVYTNAPSYSVPAATAMPASSTLTMADLAKLGTVIQRLEYPAGTLAGAQIEFSTAWTAPAGWTIQKNGSPVTSVSAGDVASVWSPENIRPLSEN